MSVRRAPDDLRPALDALAERGSHLLRTRLTRHVLREGLPFALFCTILPPLAVLVVQGVQRIVGTALWQPPVWSLVAASALAFLIVIAGLAAWASRRPIPRRAALALFDRAADAGERLVAADELLERGTTGGFAAAAIEDAHWFLRPALEATPAAPAAPAPTSSIPRGALCALAALVLAWSLGGSGGRALGARVDVVPPPASTDVAQAPREGGDTEVPGGRTTPPAGTEEEPGPDAALEIEPRETEAASRPGELPEEAKRKEGKGGAGRSSEAQASRGESDARGTPTNQGPESKKQPVRKPLGPDTKKKKRGARKPAPKQDPKKSAGEESGSTAGRGSSKGSNRNPVTSDWTSKDQVTTEDDEEIEDDEDVEDDTEDSEARGGMQPTLRDRKPPVSRDLTIGFGNQPNPNANGRGGPSQPKKSRGTASLVLGVPIPDRVKGQPNPGKTKITQERVEPRREQAPPGTAQARTPRQGPTGPLAAPRFAPWLRELLRRHFLRSERQPK